MAKSKTNYVDGFVLTVPKKKLKVYKKMAAGAGKVWRKHGAIDYKECVAEDMRAKGCLPFPKLVKPKAGEVILFSYITYKSRKHRDAVNKKVMAEMQKKYGDKEMEMPFDIKRMAYGGFDVLVSA